MRPASSEANARLEPSDRDFSVWPGPALPRTEALHKLKRREIQQWVSTGTPPATIPSRRGDLDQVLARYARGQPVSTRTTLDELGLKSLDRIELTLALEEQTGGGLSEGDVAACQTVGDLHLLVAAATQAGTAEPAFTFPRWATSAPARAIRNVSQQLWILPLAGLFLRLRVDGLEHLEALPGPVIFAESIISTRRRFS
jgi:long-chain acyl-CoA synthetase